MGWEFNPYRLPYRHQRGTLGTFPGVFTPSILTIIGIILFLRLGDVVGSVGLGRTLLIILLANLISVLTSLSLAAISTSLNVKGGGLYYLISRTLGAEFGGAIGIVLFLAQSVSIGFYCIGFGEAVQAAKPQGVEGSPQIIAVAAVALLFVFAWLGADWGTRFQYVVMAMIFAALVSFYLGGLRNLDSHVWARNWEAPLPPASFWVLFAIFFPAVTGFTQGASMSGDLKDPGRSLPLGTLWAVGLSIVIYFSAALVFAGALPGEELRGDYGAMKRVAGTGWIISMGVIAATLSSAMASFLGAPRILQSLAQDRVFPFLLPFAKGAGFTQNPRHGVLLSGGIALATVGLGQLNLIAPVVTMFFLISYGLLNYATFYEARAASPAFRPTFRWFHFRLSLLGALGCLAVMMVMDPVSSVAAVAVLFGLHQYLKRTAGPARWADGKRSYHFQLVREHLLEIPAEPEHPRDWRPQLLALSDSAHRRKPLLRFASWMEGGSGLTTVVRILIGKGPKIFEERAKAEAEIRADIEEEGLKVFSRVIVAPDLRAGLQGLIQSFGIGPIRPNTILLNGPEQLLESKDPLGQRQLGNYFREAIRLGSNVVIFNSQEEKWAAVEKLPSQERRIHVWWRDDATSRLMLLFAYLMTRSSEWSDARIQVMASAPEGEAERRLERLKQVLQDVRIPAEPEVLPTPSIDQITEISSEASLVFLPLRVQRNQIISPLGGSWDDLLSRLPLVALVIAAEDIDLQAEPEEGAAAELAAALDAAADAEKEAKKAEKEALKAAEIAGEKQKAWEEAREKGEDPDKLREMEEAAREAGELAEKTAREAAMTRTEAEAAARSAEAAKKEANQK